MQIPALAGAIDEIARTVANIPIKLYKKEGKRVEEIKGDRRVFYSMRKREILWTPTR